MPRLVHVSADEPGYVRKGRGKGFEYFDEKGRKLKDTEILERIRKLRIPPAWKNVWICANPDGHLQATGIDAKGRKQYIYHEEWNRRSHLTKFDRMAGFAKALPQIRKKISQDLNKKGWPREKVISLVISILDQLSLRIGNKAYEHANKSYGLTTLRRKHLKVENGGITFKFKGKSGLYHKTPIRGKKLTRLIQECSELPGQEVFTYLDEEGNSHPVFSHDVNAYLHEISGGEFTAKDFRTWRGSVLALEMIPEAKSEIEETPKRSLLPVLIKKVAQKLGNTIAVCKTYYIHPTMLAMAERKEFDIEQIHQIAKNHYPDIAEELSKYELIALFLIEGQKDLTKLLSVKSK